MKLDVDLSDLAALRRVKLQLEATLASVTGAVDYLERHAALGADRSVTTPSPEGEHVPRVTLKPGPARDHAVELEAQGREIPPALMEAALKADPPFVPKKPAEKPIDKDIVSALVEGSKHEPAEATPKCATTPPPDYPTGEGGKAVAKALDRTFKFSELKAMLGHDSVKANHWATGWLRCGWIESVALSTYRFTALGMSVRGVTVTPPEEAAPQVQIPARDQPPPVGTPPLVLPTVDSLRASGAIKADEDPPDRPRPSMPEPRPRAEPPVSEESKATGPEGVAIARSMPPEFATQSLTMRLGDHEPGRAYRWIAAWHRAGWLAKVSYGRYRMTDKAPQPDKGVS